MNLLLLKTYILVLLNLILTSGSFFLYDTESVKNSSINNLLNHSNPETATDIPGNIQYISFSSIASKHNPGEDNSIAVDIILDFVLHLMEPAFLYYGFENTNIVGAVSTKGNDGFNYIV